jgi:predicted ribosomally synthesized peptide with nif11-like leader
MEERMGNQKVMEFLALADDDADLRNRLDAALDDEDTGVASFLAVAAEEGYEFTADDFLAAMEEQGEGTESGELGDEALEGVAGGLSFGGLRMRGIARRAFQRFRGFRSGLGIRGFGGGGVAQTMMEEEEMQT